MATLHLMCGLPCSGKTTYARRLEAEQSALRLTPDEWINRLLPPDWDRSELDRLRNPTEAIQWDVAPVSSQWVMTSFLTGACGGVRNGMR
jgi:hypothetical protein